MIARQAPAANWQRALGDAVSSIGELLDLLALLPEELPVHLRPADAAARDCPVRVPRGFVSRMQLGDPADPLLLQVLPTATELVAAPGYTADPLAETGEAAAGARPPAAVASPPRARAVCPPATPAGPTSLTASTRCAATVGSVRSSGWRRAR